MLFKIVEQKAWYFAFSFILWNGVAPCVTHCISGGAWGGYIGHGA